MNANLDSILEEGSWKLEMISDLSRRSRVGRKEKQEEEERATLQFQ